MTRHTRKIQDQNLWYTLLNRYTRLFFPSAYSKIEYHGLENIPQDAAIIYAPNHTNALMDALVVLFIDKKPKVFVSRADIFRNPKVARILNFLKIMPVMRIRDGYENLKKNEETFNKAVDVLLSGTPFCILPEGTHRPMHSLLPLSKGIFRIALHAQANLPKDKPLYIVPVGIEYGNFFRYDSTLLVNIGRPIQIGAFIDSPDCAGLSEPELINAMKEELSLRMKESITYLPDDERYEVMRSYCAMRNKASGSLHERMKKNQEIIREYGVLKEKDSSQADKLYKEAAEVSEKLRRHKISLSSLTKRHLGTTVVLRLIVALTLLPWGLVGSILNSPILLLSEYIYRLTKDDAFYNSLRFGVTALLWPILAIIYSCIWIHSMELPGYLINIASIVVIFMTNHFSTWYFRFSRRLWSDLKYLSYR